jgi:hypothetical protein
MGLVTNELFNNTLSSTLRRCQGLKGEIEFGAETHEDEIDYDYFWADDDCHGQRMARKHGLKSPQPIMCTTRDSDDCIYVSVWQQVLPLEPDRGQYMGDCDVNGPGEDCNRAG